MRYSRVLCSVAIVITHGVLTMPGTVSPECFVDVFTVSLQARYHNPHIPDENMRPRLGSWLSLESGSGGAGEPGLCLLPHRVPHPLS